MERFIELKAADGEKCFRENIQPKTHLLSSLEDRSFTKITSILIGHQCGVNLKRCNFNLSLSLFLSSISFSLSVCLLLSEWILHRKRLNYIRIIVLIYEIKNIARKSRCLKLYYKCERVATAFYRALRSEL